MFNQISNLVQNNLSIIMFFFMFHKYSNDNLKTHVILKNHNMRFIETHVKRKEKRGMKRIYKIMINIDYIV